MSSAYNIFSTSLSYYACVHNVCEYIQSTHWLVPGYCLGQIFLHGEERPRRQPRNLSNGDSSLAKIGVNLVSCSCGNMEFHRHWWSTNRFRHQPLETICCTRRLEWSCTTYFVNFAWNFCTKLVTHQLTVILGLVSTRAIFWKLIPGKPVATNLVSEPGWPLANPILARSKKLGKPTHQTLTKSQPSFSCKIAT